MKVGKPSYLLKKYVYVLRVKRMFSIKSFQVRCYQKVKFQCLFIHLFVVTNANNWFYILFCLSIIISCSLLGKFMGCLCHCLVKFAQKGGDESNISFESESEGLFISFYLFQVSFLSFCFVLSCFVCLFVVVVFFLRVLISKLHSSEKVF